MMFQRNRLVRSIIMGFGKSLDVFRNPGSLALDLRRCVRLKASEFWDRSLFTSGAFSSMKA